MDIIPADTFFNTCYDIAWCDYGYFGKHRFDLYWGHIGYLYSRWNEERCVLDEYPLTRVVDHGKTRFI